MIHDQKKTCPRCGYAKLKNWAELDEEQKMLVERLPGSAQYPFEARKLHIFCQRCWFEILPHLPDVA